MESALLADGVPADQVYETSATPEGVERAGAQDRPVRAADGACTASLRRCRARGEPGRSCVIGLTPLGRSRNAPPALPVLLPGFLAPAPAAPALPRRLTAGLEEVSREPVEARTAAGCLRSDLLAIADRDQHQPTRAGSMALLPAMLAAWLYSLSMTASLSVAGATLRPLSRP
jgi:hypothetical protein